MTAPQKATNLHVTMIDDEEVVHFIFQTIAKKMEGINTAVYGDAMTVLKLIEQNKFDSDLILLDINMPRMDGKTFLRTVKRDDRLKAIPVVMFTSSESPNDIRECYESFASGYVVKPFDGRQYAERLDQVVNFWGNIGELPDAS